MLYRNPLCMCRLLSIFGINHSYIPFYPTLRSTDNEKSLVWPEIKLMVKMKHRNTAENHLYPGQTTI